MNTTTSIKEAGERITRTRSGSTSGNIGTGSGSSSELDRLRGENMKRSLTDVLKHGAENAIPSLELCEMLGVDLRTLNHLVQQARRDHIPVCSSMSGKTGLFLGDAEEVRRTCRQLEHRALTSLRTRRDLRACLLPDDNQISFLD